MHKFTPKAVESDNPHYDPKALLDTLMQILGCRNDRQLANRLGVQPSQICKIGKRRVSVSPALLISMHEETGLSIRQLRALMGDYRVHTGASAKHPVHPQLQYLNGVRPLQARHSLLPRTGITSLAA
jgi:DNA-binding transcriptional regulator YdaS (Cro superfamily)